MLPFRQQEDKPAEMPVRWKIGIDQRQVALYVGLALVAGFTLGFAAARFTTDKPATSTGLTRAENSPRALSEGALSSEYRLVVRLLRADTVELEGIGPVRMIGIETPDGKSQYMDHGKNALAFAENMLLEQSVRPEFDPATAARNYKDEEGQTVAYLYTRDGVMVNKELLKQGHAFVRVSEPFRLADEFRAQELEAMASMRGVWGLSGSSAESASKTSDVKPAPTGAASPGDKPKRLSPLLPSEIGPNIPAVSGATTSGTTTSSEPTVAVSSSDRMYHRSGCEYLSKKKEIIALSDAKARGYAACGRCFASTVLRAP